MANPFMMLTDWSVERPKQAFAAVMLTMVLLASGGMHLKFDNSEDGFFPDDPSVDLLNEVEGEYRANIDFIRVIDDIESGDLLTPEAWSTLATIEAGMLNDSNFAPYHYPLFGTQANNGPAGHAMQWLALQDAATAASWLQPLQASVTEALTATDDDNLSSALVNLSSAAALVPPVELVSAERLEAWDPGQPAEWLPRLDTGNNLSGELGALMGQLQAMTSGRSPSKAAKSWRLSARCRANLAR